MDYKVMLSNADNTASTHVTVLVLACVRFSHLLVKLQPESLRVSGLANNSPPSALPQCDAWVVGVQIWETLTTGYTFYKGVQVPCRLMNIPEPMSSMNLAGCQ